MLAQAIPRAPSVKPDDDLGHCAALPDRTCGVTLRTRKGAFTGALSRRWDASNWLTAHHVLDEIGEMPS